MTEGNEVIIDNMSQSIVAETNTTVTQSNTFVAPTPQQQLIPPKMNRKERRKMTAIAGSKETKRIMERVVNLATMVFDKDNQAGDWIQARIPEFMQNTPLMMVMAGHGEFVLDYLRKKLADKKAQEAVQTEPVVVADTTMRIG